MARCASVLSVTAATLTLLSVVGATETTTNTDPRIYADDAGNIHFNATHSRGKVYVGDVDVERLFDKIDQLWQQQLAPVHAQTTPPGPTSHNTAECDNNTSFEAAPPTATSDRVCRALTVCNGTQFERVPPTPTSDRQCEPVSECAPNYFEVSPPTPTSDRRCEPADPCASAPCINGGTCRTTGAVEYECSCRFPFVGPQCQTSMNLCGLYNPCENGADCINVPQGIRCQCKPATRCACCDETLVFISCSRDTGSLCATLQEIQNELRGQI